MNMIEFQQNKSIGYIILNRPEKRNALSFSALIELEKIIQEMKSKTDLKVVILKGKGQDFCSGHDLSELINPVRSIHHYRRIFSLSARIMETFHCIPQPIIAQIQGHATAAGCQLVSACDLAIAEKNALFSTPGVRIGLFCSTPMVPLSRTVGRKHALEMLLTGKNITAEEAKQIGLINKVVDNNKLVEETEKLAHEISNYSADILAIGKQAFYQQIDQNESLAYDFSKEIIAFNCLHDDAQEGIHAKLEKRTPQWKSNSSEQN